MGSGESSAIPPGLLQVTPTPAQTTLRSHAGASLPFPLDLVLSVQCVSVCVGVCV